MMKKTCVLFACLLAFLSLVPVRAEEEEESEEIQEVEEQPEETDQIGPDLKAQTAILIDSASGTVLARKNAGRTMSPAALTKMMGVYLAAESLKDDQPVTMSSDAFQTYDHSSGVIWVMEGETLPAVDLEYASILQNANDTMAMLAEAAAGSPDQFVGKMNETAQELGMANTHYSNLFGLYDEELYTTAEDMAILTRKALRTATFRKVFGTSSYRIAPTALQSNERLLAANCEMLRSGSDYYEEAQGCVIGYTQADGYVLAVEAKKDGLSLIAVVLGEETEPDTYTDARTLFEYGFSSYRNVEITPAKIGTKTVEIYENDNHVADVTFSVEQSFSALLSSAVDPEKLRADIVLYNEETNNPNLIEGEVVFTLDGQQVGTAEMKKTIETYDTVAAKKEVITPRQVFDYGCIGVLAVIVLARFSSVVTPPGD